MQNIPPSPSPVVLHCHSAYSFLDSTLSIPRLIELALRRGVSSLALTDLGNLHGAVPFLLAGRTAGLRPILGAEIRLDGQPLLLYPENRQGFASLCRMLSACGRKDPLGGRRTPAFRHDRFVFDTAGLVAVGARAEWADRFPKAFYLGTDRRSQLEALQANARYPVALVPGIHYAEPGDRGLYDILQSMRTLTRLDQIHPEKRRGRALHFPHPHEWRERFGPGAARALAVNREIAERCRFDFNYGSLQFPAFHPPDGSAPREFLRRRVLDGLRERYGADASSVRPQVETELAIIHEVGYEDYFLIVWDILQECRRRGIAWITRGSAADSLVCYALGISNVCPVRFDLYFRRFLNRERMRMRKLPDIDMDFPHDRKDDVLDLIFAKYGPDHAAIVGGFSTFQARSALTGIAKVLGLSEQQLRPLTARLPAYTSASALERRIEESVECTDLRGIEEPYATAIRLAHRLDGLPIHPKMHPCGVVLSRDPILSLTPCFTAAKGYPTTHFDMDAVEAIGLVKMDILAQGGLAVIRDVEAGLAERRSDPQPPPVQDCGAGNEFADPAVWDLIASGQARAVHHIESPAMLSLCRMCNVRDIDTLIAIVSVIRPGAANQHKKQSFARRYQGREPWTLPHPSLAGCLSGTYGLIIYEEQVLQICEAFAGIPPGEGDTLRRALVKQREADIEAFGCRFAEAALAMNRKPFDIEEVWTLLRGFSGYAFCKAHSTAYGVEAYESARLKLSHPAGYMAAVLSNGKGFYSPLVYVLECHRLGIPLLPPRVNDPGPAFAVRNGAIRVPALRILGLGETTSARWIKARRQAPFADLDDFLRRARPEPEEAMALLRAGALDEFGPARTALFWQLQRRLKILEGEGNPDQLGLPLDTPPPDRSTKASSEPPPTPLDEPSLRDRLAAEMDLFGFTVSAHPLDLYDGIHWSSYCAIADLHRHLSRRVVCCGLVIETRIAVQSTGEPMKFLSIADRSGIIETELFADTYRRHGLATVRYPVLEVEATVEPFENGRGYTLRVHRAGEPRNLGHQSTGRATRLLPASAK